VVEAPPNQSIGCRSTEPRQHRVIDRRTIFHSRETDIAVTAAKQLSADIRDDAVNASLRPTSDVMGAKF
jgi:hypothetical protein